MVPLLSKVIIVDLLFAEPQEAIPMLLFVLPIMPEFVKLVKVAPPALLPFCPIFIRADELVLVLIIVPALFMLALLTSLSTVIRFGLPLPSTLIPPPFSITIVPPPLVMVILLVTVVPLFIVQVVPLLQVPLLPPVMALDSLVLS